MNIIKAPVTKEDIIREYEFLNRRVAKEIRGGEEIARFDRYALYNKLDKNSWDGVYASLLSLSGFLRDHKRYEPEWARSERSEELINSVLSLAGLVKSSFPVTL